MTERITRRDFIADGLFLGLASVLPIARMPGASAAETFIAGVNYPWVAYGHDFGRNGWGYDGLSTGGWTYQTYPDSQGFVDVRRTTERSHSGRYSLRVDADLLGGHPNRSKGEVYVSIEAHPPRGSASPLNLEGGGFECWLFFPPGASGDPHAPNGIQMFLKSKIGDNWYSWYSYWQNILSSWEGRWIQISISLSDPPGYSDAQFDPRHVIAAGVKVGVNSSSSAALQGPIYLDDVVFRADSAASYDFEKAEKDGENFPWPPCGELQLDKPCIIGEVATKSTGYSPQEYLRAAMSGGYAGLLFWSYRARDEFSAWPQNLSATLMSCGSLDRPAWRHALGPG